MPIFFEDFGVLAPAWGLFTVFSVHFGEVTERHIPFFLG